MDCLVSRAMEPFSRRTVYGTRNGHGIKSRQKKRLPLLSTCRSGNRQSVTATMFDSVRISSNPWTRLKADYRGGQCGNFFASTVFSRFLFSFVVSELRFSFPFFWRCCVVVWQSLGCEVLVAAEAWRVLFGYPALQQSLSFFALLNS